MSAKNVIIGMILICILSLIYQVGEHQGLKKGFEKGFEKGFSVTIDTVQAIMQNQINSDTSVTKLILINPDTNVYILKAKSLTIK